MSRSSASAADNRRIFGSRREFASKHLFGSALRLSPGSMTKLTLRPLFSQESLHFTLTSTQAGLLEHVPCRSHVFQLSSVKRVLSSVGHFSAFGGVPFIISNFTHRGYPFTRITYRKEPRSQKTVRRFNANIMSMTSRGRRRRRNSRCQLARPHCSVTCGTAGSIAKGYLVRVGSVRPWAIT
jgi:hypothetical protein